MASVLPPQIGCCISICPEPVIPVNVSGTGSPIGVVIATVPTIYHNCDNGCEVWYSTGIKGNSTDWVLQFQCQVEPALEVLKNGDNYEYASGEFDLSDPDTVSIYSIYVVGTPGIEQIEIGAGIPEGNPVGDLPTSGINYIFSGDFFYLKNSDTGNYHELWRTGLPGVIQLLVDVPVAPPVPDASIAITGNNYRFVAPCTMQLKHETDGTWGDWSIVLVGGVPSIQLT